MKKYSDYQKDKNKQYLTNEEVKLVKWTKFKIVVPSLGDKQEIIDSFKEFHDNGYDPDLVTPNQLAHEYLNGENILVNEKIFELLDSKKNKFNF